MEAMLCRCSRFHFQPNIERVAFCRSLNLPWIAQCACYRRAILLPTPLHFDMPVCLTTGTVAAPKVRPEVLE
jgi:hypothetical protein